ncbi:MAG: LysR family transcriptional regulator [Lachnospiraceae bacterium]|jgi:DNA-binding transcriptional LysR family regulator|nr:LysR family transcriptional regulator [Lachnospiraceae bacterium]
MIDSKLETLLVVTETKSFTKAAAQLSLTQPAVSQHIRQLERELGVKIFVRGSGELRLTEEGEIVHKYAKRIQVLYQNMRQSLIDSKRHFTRLAVGVTHTAESNLVLEALAQYGNQHGGILLTIVSDTITNLYNKLKTYEIDIAIIEGKFSDPNFNSLLLDTDYLVLAVSNDNPLSRKSMVTLRELQKEKMILRLPNSATRGLFISHLESNNYSIEDFNVIMEVDNIEIIKDLIRHNFGVSILARSACLDELKKGKLQVLPIENLSMTREVNIIYHKDFAHLDLLDDLTKLYHQTANME